MGTLRFAHSTFYWLATRNFGVKIGRSLWILPTLRTALTIAGFVIFQGETCLEK
ncbi:MAG: hypothetical protein F6K42_08030 [Leptolyngbya sp. SIO1D8]|nr:hypothetical protein [Leptolyngbya sp. SIO1D8]